MKTHSEIKQTIETVLKSNNIETPDGKILDNVDSLSLVTFVLDLERVFDLQRSIVSADSMSRTKSPFKTIDTLADYILEVITNG